MSTVPTASTAAEPHRIDPRTTPVLCLPSGWRLLCLQGRVAVHGGPLLYGQVLHRQQQQLAPGQQMEGGQDGMPLWLQLHCLDAAPVQLQLLAPTAQPGWAARLHTAVRRLLGRRRAAHAPA